MSRCASLWLIALTWSCILSLSLPWLIVTAYSPPVRPRDYTVLSSSSLARIANVSAELSDAILDFHNPSSSLAKMLIPRAVGSQNLTTVQNLIRDHFAHLTTAIGSTSATSSRQIKTWQKFEDTFDANTPYGTRTFTNLVFTHDPNADRKFVIAAHVDSKYFPGPPENGFIGATDSAAPCAMMLELATTLTPLLDRLVSRWNSDNKPRYGQRTTLQLIFFDGEEAFKDWTAQDSIYGAKHLADVWSKIENTPSPVSPQHSQLSTIDSFMLLDLLGVAGPNIRCYFLETAWLYDAMVDVENRLATQGLLWPGVRGDTWTTQSTPTGQKAKTFFEKRMDQFYTFGARIEDDHLPFLEGGVPILHMIPIPFPSVWHTLQDDASALDLETIRVWTRILRVVTAEYLALDSDDGLYRRNHARTELVRASIYVESALSRLTKRSKDRAMRFQQPRYLFCGSVGHHATSLSHDLDQSHTA